MDSQNKMVILDSINQLQHSFRGQGLTASN